MGVKPDFPVRDKQLEMGIEFVSNILPMYTTNGCCMIMLITKQLDLNSPHIFRIQILDKNVLPFALDYNTMLGGFLTNSNKNRTIFHEAQVQVNPNMYFFLIFKYEIPISCIILGGRLFRFQLYFVCFQLILYFQQGSSSLLLDCSMKCG